MGSSRKNASAFVFGLLVSLFLGSAAQATHYHEEAAVKGGSACAAFARDFVAKATSPGTSSLSLIYDAALTVCKYGHAGAPPEKPNFANACNSVVKDCGYVSAKLVDPLEVECAAYAADFRSKAANPGTSDLNQVYWYAKEKCLNRGGGLSDPNYANLCYAQRRDCGYVPPLQLTACQLYGQKFSQKASDPGTADLAAVERYAIETCEERVNPPSTPNYANLCFSDKRDCGYAPGPARLTGADLIKACAAYADHYAAWKVTRAREGAESYDDVYWAIRLPCQGDERGPALYRWGYNAAPYYGGQGPSPKPFSGAQLAEACHGYADRFARWRESISDAAPYSSYYAWRYAPCAKLGGPGLLRYGMNPSPYYNGPLPKYSQMTLQRYCRQWSDGMKAAAIIHFPRPGADYDGEVFRGALQSLCEIYQAQSPMLAPNTPPFEQVYNLAGYMPKDGHEGEGGDGGGDPPAGGDGTAQNPFSDEINVTDTAFWFFWVVNFASAATGHGELRWPIITAPERARQQAQDQVCRLQGRLYDPESGECVQDPEVQAAIEACEAAPRTGMMIDGQMVGSIDEVIAARGCRMGSAEERMTRLGSRWNRLIEACAKEQCEGKSEGCEKAVLGDLLGAFESSFRPVESDTIKQLALLCGPECLPRQPRDQPPYEHGLARPLCTAHINTSEMCPPGESEEAKNCFYAARWLCEMEVAAYATDRKHAVCNP